MSYKNKADLLCMLLLLFSSACHSVKADFGSAEISIVTATQTLNYQVEVADNDQTRSLGLMHREYMPANHGMLLRYKSSQIVSIWMKDTPLSLDIIYIDAEGMIVKIVEAAETYSLDSMPSGKKVLAVLELNAGQVKQHGIQVGDKVINF